MNATSAVELFRHQKYALEVTNDKNHVAYYLDMGLGKTFVGSEKMMQLGANINLVVCQKSKIDDWHEHMIKYYAQGQKNCVYNLTDKKQFGWFFTNIHKNDLSDFTHTAIINYELAFRRKELLQLKDFTLLLDESSMIQNENAKRSKFILKMQPKNVILLSGTPTSGKYEKLWSQLHLLGWPISKDLYWKQYIDTEILDNEGYPIKVVRGYKNVERLKRKLWDHGAVFMKSDQVFDLPEQVEQTIRISTTKEYRKFQKDSIVTIDDVELVGDTTLTKMLYERQLCGQYNKDKLDAFCDLVESTNDRLIVFYNFTAELQAMQDVLMDKDFDEHKRFSVVNGQIKALKNYESREDSITFIQYQAGAMGLNLQKANKIVYFTPPLSSELFEQSKKRTHRIGQERTCFYYYLTCTNSMEEKIYETLAMRRDYTNALFEEGE